MKQHYFVILFLLLVCQIGVAKPMEVLPPPSATIAGTTTVCQNSTSPVITFTGSGGTAPYTFTYKINNGASLTVTTTGSSSSVTVSVSTNTIGVFTYNLILVQDSSSSQTLNLNAIVNVVSNFTVNAGADILVCKGNPISLTSSVSGNGTNPVAYSWSGPNGFTSNQQSPNIPNSTTAMTGSYTVTASIGNCQFQDVVNVQVINVGVTNPSTLNSCLTQGQTSAQVGLILTLPTNPTVIQSITINWGDSSAPQAIPQSNWTTPIPHNYPPGSYTVLITATTSLGCTVNQSYIAFVGSSPQAATLSLFANQASGCSPHTTNFTFGIPISNSDGTNYLICFGDNTSNCINYVDGTPIPSDWVFSGTAAGFNLYTITHVYNITSCGNSVNLNGTTYNNVFLPSVVTTNPCTAPQPQAGSLISVGLAPTASFTPNPIPNICVNIPLTLNNTSNFGGAIDPVTYSCNPVSPFYWTISPSGGAQWTATGLGSDNGFPSNELFWTLGSMTPSITFNQPGNYTITLFVKNSCGISSISRTVCVEPPLTPQFNLNTNNGCIPLAVTATNTTNVVNQCSAPTYLWSVAYLPAFCGTTITPIPNQTTPNASFNFTEPGTYTITLSTTNACGTTTTAQTVTVKKPPTVTIAPIPNACGSATITPTANVTNCAPTGGTLTYAWTFTGGTPATANTLNPGTITYSSGGPYSVTLQVTNECGVSNTATQSFSVGTAPTITNTTLNQIICSGSQTTLVNLTANQSGTTFSWNATATSGITGFTPSGTSNTIPIQTISTTNANPGSVTYVITPTFNGCVGPTATYIINVNPAPSITAQPTSSSVCLNGSATVLSVTLSSTSGTPTYQWYSNVSNSNSGGTLIVGATSSTYNPPTTTLGTLYYYCVITLSSGGCSGLSTLAAAVTVNPLPTIATQPLQSQNLCVGSTIPSALSIISTGGIGTATYQWYSNTVNANSGGTLIPGATNATYTPPVFNVAATYYFYATVTLSGNGCGLVTSNIAEIIVFNDPVITAQPLATQTLCQGATPTNLVVTASGGNGSFTYQWYSNANNNTTLGTIIAGATNATYSPPTTSVVTLYYYCIVSQATLGCSVTSATAAVNVNASPTILSQPQSSTVCSGGTPTVLSLTFSTGAGTPTYQWYSNTSNDTTTGSPISGETNSTYAPPANTVGTMYYYALLTFPNITGSCATIASNTAIITVTAGAIINQQPLISQGICVGGTITTPLSVSFTGGTGTPSYQWYSNTSNSNTGGTLINGATNVNYTPPAFTTAGNAYYYVIISFSGSGCGAITSDVATIIVANDPIVDVQPTANQTLCQSAIPTALSISVSGGIGSIYTYQWYVSTLNNTSSGTAITGETNPIYIPPTNTAGTLYYYCIISQPNGIGCSATTNTAEVIINLAPAIVNQPSSSSICLGQTATVLSFTIANGVGVPTYQWYSNSNNSNTGGTIINGATNATFNPPSTVSGTSYYYCVVTFPTITGGCSVISTNAAEVIINPNPVIASEIVTICSGVTFTVIPTNSGSNIVPVGTSYIWSNPVVNPLGSITGATSQATPQSQISQNLINTTTSPATVTYTVTPTSGVCIGNNFTITVTVNPAINPNVVVNNSTCFGVNNASITTNVTGGIPFATGAPYLISWTGPNGFNASANSITSIVPGTYNLTIDDAGGCPFSDSYLITEPADILISVDSENDITCFGSNNGSINITVTGGTGNHIFTWTHNGSPHATSEDVANLSPGTYVVSVTDANNCGPKTETFTITQPPLLVVGLSSQTNVLCYGASTGAITVTVTGGTPIQFSPGVFDYNFSWTGPNGFTGNTQNLTNIPAGIYNLTVTDNLGCVKNLTVTITQSAEIIVSYTTTPITCYGANNASLSATISGGNGPYQYQWNNLATTLNQTNLSAGNYIITVTDNVGCIKVETIIIPEAPIFTVNPIVTNVSCYGANNGSINLNLTGGIAPVALSWSDGSTAGLIRNNLSPGTYTATISDGTPCFIVRTFTIIQPQPLVLSANITNPLDCVIANGGAINLIVSGGTGPFNFSWSNGATSEDLANLNAGNYLVTVTDANNCSVTGQYTLIRPAPIAIAVNTQTDFDCATHEVTQSYVAQATGGVPPYQYQWSSGNVSGTNGQIMSSVLNGTVILTVTDNAGCNATYTVDVDNPEIGYASFEATSYGYSTYGIYAIGDPIQFNSTITGDYVSVSWDFGDGTFSTELNPIHTYAIPRDYVVTQTVTYPFGCVYVQTITLIVEKGYLLVVPTAFTPNDDTVNDNYRPVTKRLKNVRLDIYDTWGSIVYTETGDVLVGWDGKINGFNAENGNYYSKVTAETFYGTIINENQTFVLIK